MADVATPDHGDYGKRPAKMKQFGKRPARPDFTERDDKLARLQAKVKEYLDLAKTKLGELEALQNENKANNKLEGLRRALANSVHQRQQVQKLQEITRKRLADLKDLKVKVPGRKAHGVDSSPAEILAMMESLKAKLPAHEDDPDEYHRLIARIQALHASYEQLTAPADANGAGGADAARAALQGDLDKHTAELGTIREREAEERAQLDALREQLDASQPHVERLRKERETCLDVVSRLRDQMSAINEQWQAKFDEFKASMDAWAQERRDVLKEREEQKAQEQKEREEQRAAREAEARGPPFRDQIVACEQLLLWCRQYTGKADSAAKENNGAARGPAELDGLVAFSKKTVEGDGDVFATSRSKSKKSRGSRANRGATNGAADTKAAPPRVQHDIETLGLLGSLKLPVPKTAAEVEEIAATVKTRKADYEAKQKRKLAGEEVSEDDAEFDRAGSGDEAPSKAKKQPAGGKNGAGGKKGEVELSIKCDEAFNMVLVELMAH